MSKGFLEFNKVSFGYDSSVQDLFEGISFQLSKGWTGVIGPNGSGKTTLLKLACGQLNNYSGTIRAPLIKVYCEQRTDYPPANMNEFFRDHSKQFYKLADSLKLEPEWAERWGSLSHGERKRLQLAAALWSKPELLAIDEPTNHLDAEAREMIINTLKNYNGVGLLISHDRDMLDSLCSRNLFIDSSGVTLRHGNFTQGAAQQKLENESALKQLEEKKREYAKLQKEYKRRSRIADKAKKKSSKKNIDVKDRDAKSKIDLGRLTGKDAVGGKLKSQLASRLEKTENELNNIKVKREYETGIIMTGTFSHRNYLLKLEPGQVELNENKKLAHKELMITPKDRIALTGPNGSGKSTLLKLIVKKLNIPKEHLAYIPQEISIEETKEILEEVGRLPNDKLGKLLIIISRLGSDAERILQTGFPSPGETRKILLGLGISREPHLIIMDEPTNHMDLVSIECLENALKDISCTLLLVSHDKRFLKALTTKEWKIRRELNGYILVEE
ncbi:MAG: ATP-binding cassette domain-containing protein [Ignavibacteria bacterium]|jgi:ATPase subunit of ABC transporter with duplicated ATPase domains